MNFLSNSSPGATSANESKEKKVISVQTDAWSHGQIQSKIWLARELEARLSGAAPLNIWVLGGWYGLLPFILFSREKLRVERISSFDLEKDCGSVAAYVNNAWGFSPTRFVAHAADCENLSFVSGQYGPAPDLIINTAVEHFSSGWLEAVPPQTYLCLQSTNMEHPEHIFRCQSLEDFSDFKKYFGRVDFFGKLEFHYVDRSFERYMIMGTKKGPST